jgi:hypothetical protein
LLDRLQNGTRRKNGGSADQSVLGRMGLGTACKKKNLKDEEYFWRKEKYVLGLRKTVYSQKNLYRHDDVHCIDNDDETARHFPAPLNIYIHTQINIRGY